MPTTTSCWIDYSAFPHIFDNILCYADKETLWNVRKTCRHGRKLSEKLLADTAGYTTWPTTEDMKKAGHGKSYPAYNQVLRTHQTLTRTLEMKWAGEVVMDQAGGSVRSVERLLNKMPNVELVVMTRQRPLSNPGLLDRVQPRMRRARPDTHTVHHVTLPEALKSGTLAVPVAYGGGPVLVNVSLGPPLPVSRQALRNLRIHHLDRYTAPTSTFYFFLSYATPRARAAYVTANIMQPFIRAVVEQLANASSAQFTFVRNKRRWTCDKKGSHPLKRAIAAELGPWKEDKELVQNIWERAWQQVHVITFDELRSKVSPRVWEQVAKV